MPTQWSTFPIKFEGGLITNRGRLEQGLDFPGSATNLQNFEADVQGGYTRIQGFTKFSDTEVPGTGQVKGIVAVELSKILAFRGGKAYTSAGGAWTEVLTIPNDTYTRIFYEGYDYGSGKKFVVVDGINPPAFYTVGTGLIAYNGTLPTDLTGARFVKDFQHHLFFAVGKELIWGAPYSDSDFAPGNGAGVINIGETITGLISFRKELFIFCLNKIFRLSGNTIDDFQLNPVTTNTGCLCGFTIKEVGGDIMYLSSDGMRYLSASERENDFGLTRASESIQSKFNELSPAECIFSSVTISEKNQYRIFVYEDTVPGPQAKGFIATKFSNQTADDISWSTTHGMKVYATSEFMSRDREHVFFCGETGYVYRMEAGNSFDGEPIIAIFETPFMPVEDPKIRKTYYKLTTYTRSTTGIELFLDLLFDYDKSGVVSPEVYQLSSFGGGSIYGDPGSVYGTSLYGSSVEVELDTNLEGSSFVVALKYTSNSTQPSFNINFATLEYRTNERR